MALALLPAAWLCRRHGDAHVGAAGLALFCAAPLRCGVPVSLRLLLVLRGLQGLGGAALLVASVELLDAGRPGTGRRMWVAASVFGIAVGPAIGGGGPPAAALRGGFSAPRPA